MTDQEQLHTKLDALMVMVMSYQKEIAVLRKEISSVAEHSYVCAKITEEHQNKFEEVFSEIQKIRSDINGKKRGKKTSPEIKKSINEIKISGLPNNPRISSLEAVKTIFNSLEVTNLIGDVIETREFVNKNIVTSTTKSIVVTMKSDVIANHIVNKSRKKRGLASSELFGGNNSGLVYINELLPKETFDLYMKVRQEKKKCLWKSAWHEFGYIYIKKSEKSEVVRIDNKSDLDFI